jgi:murein DD-endopeptidase MepM/ murein hydrolase activator NlpD
LAGRTARWAAVKTGKALAGKLLVALLAGIKAAALVLVKVLLVVGPILLVLLLILGLLYLAFYSVFPSHGILAGVDPDERDAIIREWAEEAVVEWNVRETWLVDGEGSWYPRAGTHLGRLVDRYGRDTRLANRWGDVHMPAVLLAMQEEDDPFLNDDAWVQERYADAAESLRPWFYYKESTVTYCAPADEDGGGGGCSTDTVYLLVEAYTIRGHFRYTHEWHTETYADGGSVTYERPLDVEVVSDGREYLLAYLERVFETPQAEDREWLVLAFEEGSIAYTEQQERLDWLIQEHDVPVYAFLSGSAIPPEYRDFLAEAEERYGIPAWFLAGLIQVQSNWNPRAEGGLAGLLPDDDPYNPRKQILAASARLVEVLGVVDWNGEWRSHAETALQQYQDFGIHRGVGLAWAADILDAAEAFQLRSDVWPLPGYHAISSSFGMRLHPIWKTWRMHIGIDIPAPTGTPVVAVAGGIAEVLNQGSEGYGLYVIVRGVQADYYYAHLSRCGVRTGDMVLPGQIIGEVGSTGDSTGPHLHFEVRVDGQPVDPLGVL